MRRWQNRILFWCLQCIRVPSSFLSTVFYGKRLAIVVVVVVWSTCLPWPTFTSKLRKRSKLVRGYMQERTEKGIHGIMCGTCIEEILTERRMSEFCQDFWICMLPAQTHIKTQFSLLHAWFGGTTHRQTHTHMFSQVK